MAGGLASRAETTTVTMAGAAVSVTMTTLVLPWESTCCCGSCTGVGAGDGDGDGAGLFTTCLSWIGGFCWAGGEEAAAGVELGDEAGAWAELPLPLPLFPLLPLPPLPLVSPALQSSITMSLPM